MFTSFSTALSALNAHATAVDVVGNNLANLNTTGYKTNVVVFHDLVSQSLGAEVGQTQIGFGVTRPSTIRQFSQGAIQTSSGPLDMAIQGDGFLLVEDSGGRSLFTRGGNLRVDKSGVLTTVTGEKVQGWREIDGVLNTNGPVTDLIIPVGTIRPPQPTSEFSVDLNLNAQSTAGPPPDTFSSSVEIFDSLGTSHIVTVSYTRATVANTWNYSISIPAADTTTATTPVTGTLTFDSEGRLATPDATDDAPVLEITGLTNGASDISLAWDLYDGTTPRVTQFSQPSAISANSQNGAASWTRFPSRSAGLRSSGPSAKFRAI